MGLWMATIFASDSPELHHPDVGIKWLHKGVDAARTPNVRHLIFFPIFPIFDDLRIPPYSKENKCAGALAI
ncbi:hypothetical protein KP509_22G054500 [Ceratopteris richardii]|nr:hypothetical protein KP509_22G054500 [Ceratopteris richardii]